MAGAATEPAGSISSAGRVGEIFKWYCPKDGSRWNVRVRVLLMTDELAVISGKRLVSTVRQDGEGVIAVPRDTLHDHLQYESE